MERAEYHRHSRARMAETAKDASRHPAPDAPKRIDHRRRYTRHDHRTCCRGSRGSASLPCHTLRKRVEMGHAGSRRRPILSATTSPLYARRYTRASSPRCSLYDPRRGSNPRRLCLTKARGWGQPFIYDSAEKAYFWDVMLDVCPKLFYNRQHR